MEDGTLFMAHSIGSQTLLGNNNCFSVFVREVTRDDIVSGCAEEYRIVNFYLEALESLINRGLTWPIQCKLIAGRTAILHDPRIVEHFYNSRFCEVCCPKVLLPLPQLQAHEREIMRGARIEHEGFIELHFGKKADFN